MRNQQRERTPTATKREAVLRVLRASEQPLTAYEILDRTRKAGVRAPTTAYRILEQLGNDGLVHRIDSINSFVACSHAQCTGSNSALFSICTSCGSTDELADPALARLLRKQAANRGFALRSVALELRGLCAACSSES